MLVYKNKETGCYYLKLATATKTINGESGPRMAVYTPVLKTGEVFACYEIEFNDKFTTVDVCDIAREE